MWQWGPSNRLHWVPTPNYPGVFGSELPWQHQKDTRRTLCFVGNASRIDSRTKFIVTIARLNDRYEESHGKRQWHKVKPTNQKSPLLSSRESPNVCIVICTVFSSFFYFGTFKVRPVVGNGRGRLGIQLLNAVPGGISGYLRRDWNTGMVLMVIVIYGGCSWWSGFQQVLLNHKGWEFIFHELLLNEKLPRVCVKG